MADLTPLDFLLRSYLKNIFLSNHNPHFLLESYGLDESMQNVFFLQLTLVTNTWLKRERQNSTKSISSLRVNLNRRNKPG